MTQTQQSHTPTAVATGEAAEALIQRMWIDHELVTKLLLNRDIAGVIREEGFDLDESFVPWVELSVKKMRTYITDQLHFLEAKRHRNPAFSSSGNGASDW